MSPRIKKGLLAAAYTSFYVLALLLFASLTFPFERLKDRVLREFDAKQKGPNPMSLRIEKITGYWLTGVEAQGVELAPLLSAASVAAPKLDEALAGAEAGSTAPEATGTGSNTEVASGDSTKPPAKPKPMRIDSVHARVSLLRLLFGTFHVNFGANMFGGKLNGFTSDAGGGRRLEAEFEDIDLLQAPMLADMVGLPIDGKLTGNIEFLLPEQKLAKADGKLALAFHGLSVGDGKAKIRDTIALPKVEIGDLRAEAEATNGQLKISNFSAKGPDLEFVAEGGARLRENVELSTLALDVRFKFSDRYANKNDTTRALLGSPGSTPGSKMPGLFDLDPKNSRAKRPDGFYAWRVSGPLAKPQFAPAAGDTAPGAAPRIFQ